MASVPAPDKEVAAIESIASRIFVIRGHRVMIDSDLAKIYGVPTKRLNEQVRRNRNRFPPDFAFPLTCQEVAILKSQIATSSWGGRRYRPWAFTEHGAVMLANILHSARAVTASVYVVRAFVHLRSMLAGHRELARRVDELERKYDGQFHVVFDAIRNLMEKPPDPPPPGEPEKDPIGFR